MKKYDYDIAVIGGGVAGVCAAVSAAREGCRTLLAEQKDYLGGAVVDALHWYLCGLYLNDLHRPFTFLNYGIADEITSSLGTCPVTRGKVELLPFSGEKLKRILFELVRREENIHLCLNHRFAGLEMIGDSIAQLTLDSDTDSLSYGIKAVIDVSGCGAVIEAAGKRGLPEERRPQLGGYSFTMAGISGCDTMLSVKVPYIIRQAADKGLVERELCLTTVDIDAGEQTAVVRLNLCSLEPEKAMTQVVKLLKSELAEFNGAVIQTHSPHLVEREGDRLLGKYVLSARDVLSAKKWSHTAAVKAAWPIEFWGRNTGPSYQYVPEGDYYEIPQDCFQSLQVKNLFAAGRCISADQLALASARVAGTCMAGGELAAKTACSTLQV